jgi:hypothetical protein
VSRFERLLLHLSTAATAASGGVYFWMKFMMTSDDPFSVLHHPWQPAMLALHVVAAPFLVFALGLMTRDHILGKIRDRRREGGRGSGLWSALTAGPMVASGYLIQVFTDPGPRRVLLVVHLGSGILFTLLFLGHVVAARARRGRGGRSRRRPARAGRRGAPHPETAIASRRLDWAPEGGVTSVVRPDRTELQAGPEGRRP